MANPIQITGQLMPTARRVILDNPQDGGVPSATFVKHERLTVDGSGAVFTREPGAVKVDMLDPATAFNFLDGNNNVVGTMTYDEFSAVVRSLFYHGLALNV